MAKEPSGAKDWSATVAHLDRVEGGPPREAFSPRRGGVVDQVRLYAIDEPPHWHVITLGLSDLGFELTLRLDRDDGSLPTWAVDLLTSLGGYARRTGHPFANGHHIDLRGPIKLDSDTSIRAAAVTIDPTAGAFGGVNFLQIVGLTADELELCRSWRTEAVLDLLRRQDRLLVTPLDRPSLMDDPALRDEAEAGVAADGSSLDELRVGTLDWQQRGRHGRRVVVTLGAGAATALGPALRRKLNHDGARFRVIGDGGEVCFAVAAAPKWRLVERQLTVEVSMSGVEELAGLFSGGVGRGSLPALAGLRFVVAA